MRTLLVLLPVMFGADGGSPDGARRPAASLESRRAFVRAFQSGAFDEARTALERRRVTAPSRVDVGYDLACVEARAGQVDRFTDEGAVRPGAAAPGLRILRLDLH